MLKTKQADRQGAEGWGHCQIMMLVVWRWRGCFTLGEGGINRPGVVGVD